MTITTILLLLSIVAGLSYYQYFYKAKNKSKLNFGFVAFSIVVWDHPVVD
jgi:ABC-type uncharacterized transport system permease subunit